MRTTSRTSRVAARKEQEEEEEEQEEDGLAPPLSPLTLAAAPSMPAENHRTVALKRSMLRSRLARPLDPRRCTRYSQGLISENCTRKTKHS